LIFPLPPKVFSLEGYLTKKEYNRQISLLLGSCVTLCSCNPFYTARITKYECEHQRLKYLLASVLAGGKVDGSLQLDNKIDIRYKNKLEIIVFCNLTKKEWIN